MRLFHLDGYMAKKKAAESKVEVGLDQTLVGQSVYFAGVPYSVNGNELVASLTKRRGGTVVDDVEPELSYLVLGRSGISSARVRAEKLNAEERADIQLVSEQEFLQQYAPTREEWILLLNGGAQSVASAIEMLPAFDATFDLSGADLRQVQFSEDTQHADLESFILDDVDLRGAHLVNVWLPGIPGAKLDGAVFKNCHVVGTCEFIEGSFKKGTAAGADFGSCDIDRADFSGTELTQADFASAIGGDVVFKKAILTDADFSLCELSNADFTGIEATNADFSGGRLSKANFSKADLRGAFFTGAELRDADFTGADLRDVDFNGADLRGAKLKSAKLKGVSLQMAELDLPSFAEASDMTADEVDTISRSGGALRELHEGVIRISRVEMWIPFLANGEKLTAHVTTSPRYVRITWNEPDKLRGGFQNRMLRGLDVRVPLMSLARRLSKYEFLANDVEVRSGKGPTGARLPKRAVIIAMCELLGMEVPPEPPPTPAIPYLPSKAEAPLETPEETRTRLMSALEGGADGVKIWNDASDDDREHVGDLSGRNFSKAQLPGIEFRHTDLSGVNCTDADMAGAQFSYCDFRNAKFRNCVLTGSQIRATGFQKADLTDASFANATLRFVKLNGAILDGTDFGGASMVSMDLSGLDLSECLLDGIQLVSVKYDDSTTWPEGFDYESHMTTEAEIARIAAEKEAALRAAQAEAELGSGVNLDEEYDFGDEEGGDDVAPDEDAADDDDDDFEADDFEEDEDDVEADVAEEAPVPVKAKAKSASPASTAKKPAARSAADEEDDDFGAGALSSTATSGEDEVDEVADLVTQLSDIIAKSRVDKAVQALQESPFQILAYVSTDSVVGVIDQTGEDDGICACHLHQDGTYGCCSESLASCASMRGSPCWHLLAMAIALVQSEKLSAATVVRWFEASAENKPQVDKDQLAEHIDEFQKSKGSKSAKKGLKTNPADYEGL